MKTRWNETEKREKENKDRVKFYQKKGEVDAEVHAFIRCSYSSVKSIPSFQFQVFGSVSPFVCMLQCEKSRLSGEKGKAGKEGLTPLVTMP